MSYYGWALPRNPASNHNFRRMFLHHMSIHLNYVGPNEPGTDQAGKLQLAIFLQNFPGI